MPCAVPFATVAVIVTLPAPVGLRVFPLTVAEPLTTDQTIVWLVALFGVTTPLRVKGVPAVADAGTPVMLDTATNGMFTVIVKFCV